MAFLYNFRRLFLALAALAMATAVSAEAANNRKNGVLPGATARDPLIIDAGTLDFFDREQKLIYSDHVRVTNGPSTLKASRLIIFLEEKKKTAAGNAATGNNDRVKHVDAEGPVTLTTKDQVSTGDRGAYDKAQNKVFLTGNVTITQPDTIVKGDRAAYDVTTGAAYVEADVAKGGRVRTTFASKKPQ